MIFRDTMKFLDLTVWALGSTYDARFLKNIGLFKKITAGEEPPNKTLSWEIRMQNSQFRI